MKTSGKKKEREKITIKNRIVKYNHFLDSNNPAKTLIKNQTESYKKKGRKGFNARRIIFWGITFLSLVIIIGVASGLAIIVPLMQKFNYFNHQFHDVFQNSGEDVNGREVQPNYNYSNVNTHENQYDNVMKHVNEMTSNMPKWGSPKQSGDGSTPRKFDYFYATMQMEKYMFQLMPTYLPQIKKNEQKLIAHGKQYQNSLPMNLLLHHGALSKPGKINDDGAEGSSGFFVNETPKNNNVNNDDQNVKAGEGYASTRRPMGFFPDAIAIIEKLMRIFTSTPAKIFNNSTTNNASKLLSPLQTFNNFFSSGGKSNYYAKGVPSSGLNFKKGELYRHKSAHHHGQVEREQNDEQVGTLDGASSPTQNLTSDGFLLRALTTFSTDYSFTVQNYFLKPFQNEINGNYKNGMANMIKNHKVNFTNLLWFFYNRVVMNLSATLFRQAVFAPLLFIEGRDLSHNLFQNQERQSQIVPADSSNITGNHKNHIFYEPNKRSQVQTISGDKDHIFFPRFGRMTYSSVFIGGSKDLPIKNYFFKYMPEFDLLPVFKHAADVVMISEILDTLNYVMLEQAEQILIWGKFKNVSHCWTVLTEAEAAFKYYFSTFTNIVSCKPDKIMDSPTQTGESFKQARGDFYCAADLTNPAISEVKACDKPNSTSLSKPLYSTAFTGQFKGHQVKYKNYLEYLCQAAPDLLLANISGDVVWTSKKTTNVFQLLSEKMFEYDPSQPDDVVQFKSFLKKSANNIFISMLAENYPGSNYFKIITKYFSARKATNSANVAW